MVSSRLSLEILKYFYDEYSLLPKINDPDISCLNFESVQWFVKHGIDLTLLVNCFARAGDLKSYRFLRGLYKISPPMIYELAWRHHFHIVEFLLKYR